MPYLKKKKSQSKGLSNNSVKRNEENNEILKQAPDGIKQNCFKEYFRMDKVKKIIFL